MTEAKRYPVEPLARLMRMTPRSAMSTFRLGRTGTDYIDRGVTAQVADRLAHLAGFIPYEVWPEMLDDAIADLERECEAPDCTVRSMPGPRGGRLRRFCSPTCGSRVRMRRYRATERGKQANRDYVRRYKAEVRARRAA